jgi:DNA-binding NtrC family response regulator
MPAAAHVFADAVLGRALRGIDVAASGDDGQLLVLLPEADAASARRMAGAVARALGEIAAGTRIGVATCPSDAADVDSLLLVARAGARVAPDGGVADATLAVVRVQMGDREVLLAHPAMVHVFELLGRLAAADLPVLIVGETGSGKENAAFAVHHRSSRRDRPFVPLNCAALSESLAESELFGHDRGAFSGAVAAKAGLFESVSGGTLFLDEVGELAPPVQAKLLRALETGGITRLGEHRERAIDVRVVAATNRVLEDEVKAGRFRQDLYFRLRGARVVLPPLRERRCEIPILFRDFLARAARRTERAVPEPSPAAMAALLAHDWPGNVRELRHVAEYLVAMVPGDRIEAGDLAGHLAAEPPAHDGRDGLRPADEVSVTPGIPARGGMQAPIPPLSEEVDELVRRRMVEALALTGGVKTQAARLLGMPLRTFTSKLRQHRLR